MLIQFQSSSGANVRVDYSPQVAVKRLRALKDIRHLDEAAQRNARAEANAIRAALKGHEAAQKVA
jgi:hypothetical protein